MTSAVGIFRAACVWAMIPLTLASGLPQMHCRCAEARGMRLCECCFAVPETTADTDVRPCCRAHQAEVARGQRSEPSACPTCGQIATRTSGKCCYWRDGDARVVAKQIDVPQHVVSALLDTVWVQPIVPEPAVVSPVWLAVESDPLPPPDRVILFRHLLI